MNHRELSPKKYAEELMKEYTDPMKNFFGDGVADKLCLSVAKARANERIEAYNDIDRSAGFYSDFSSQSLIRDYAKRTAEYFRQVLKELELMERDNIREITDN